MIIFTPTDFSNDLAIHGTTLVDTLPYTGAIEILNPFRQNLLDFLRNPPSQTTNYYHLNSISWTLLIPDEKLRTIVISSFGKNIFDLIINLGHQSGRNTPFGYLYTRLKEYNDINDQNFHICYYYLLENLLINLGINIKLQYKLNEQRYISTNGIEKIKMPECSFVYIYENSTRDEPLNISIDFIANPVISYILGLRLEEIERH